MTAARHEESTKHYGRQFNADNGFLGLEYSCLWQTPPPPPSIIMNCG